MERSLRPIDPLVHITEEATLEALGQTLARARIEAVLKARGVVEQRARKLTMVLTVLVCIAMNLFTEEAIDDVLGKLMQGPRFLRPDDDLAVARASAICQRRQQLGVRPDGRAVSGSVPAAGDRRHPRRLSVWAAADGD